MHIQCKVFTINLMFHINWRKKENYNTQATKSSIKWKLDEIIKKKIIIQYLTISLGNLI